MSGRNYIDLKQFIKKHPEEEEALHKAFMNLLDENLDIIGTVLLYEQVDYESYLKRKTGELKTHLHESNRVIFYEYK